MPLKVVQLGGQSFHPSLPLSLKKWDGFLLCIKTESIHETPLETVREHSNGKPWTWMLKARHSGPALPLHVAMCSAKSCSELTRDMHGTCAA